MNTQIGFQNELRIITILCQLSIWQTRLPISSPSLRELLASKAWKTASARSKLSLLDEQYHHHFKNADPKQRQMMIQLRQKIDDEIKAQFNIIYNSEA